MQEPSRTAWLIAWGPLVGLAVCDPPEVNLAGPDCNRAACVSGSLFCCPAGSPDVGVCMAE